MQTDVIQVKRYGYQKSKDNFERQIYRHYMSQFVKTAKKAFSDGANYIAIGAFNKTSTKSET